MSKKINLGLIGSGQWGKNYLKTAEAIADVSMSVLYRDNWIQEIKNYDGIIIATPPDSHVDIAIEVLKLNIPVMIEKPLALSYEDAMKLAPYKDNAPILVNNLHLFSPAYEYISKTISNKDIVSIYSRGSNGTTARNYSCLFDYGFHDLSMSLFLIKNNNFNIHTIFGLGNNVNNNLFNIKLSYDNINHHMISGNADFSKNRLFIVNDNKNNEFIYDDISLNKLIVNKKIQSIEKISTLENSLRHFIKSIKGYEDSRFGIDLSLNVIKILEEFHKKFEIGNIE